MSIPLFVCVREGEKEHSAGDSESGLTLDGYERQPNGTSCAIRSISLGIAWRGAFDPCGAILILF